MYIHFNNTSKEIDVLLNVRCKFTTLGETLYIHSTLFIHTLGIDKSMFLLVHDCVRLRKVVYLLLLIDIASWRF